jgi:hypothetical protein
MITIKTFRPLDGYVFGLKQSTLLVTIDLDASKIHNTFLDKVAKVISIISNSSESPKEFQSLPEQVIAIYSSLIGRHKIPIFGHGHILGVQKSNPENISYSIGLPYNNINVAKLALTWILEVLNLVYSNAKEGISVSSYINDSLPDIDKKLGQFAFKNTNTIH